MLRLTTSVGVSPLPLYATSCVNTHIQKVTIYGPAVVKKRNALYGRLIRFKTSAHKEVMQQYKREVRILASQTGYAEQTHTFEQQR